MTRKKTQRLQRRADAKETRRSRNKEYIKSIKTKGCALCAEKEPCCIDFHHLDPKDKEFNISKACQDFTDLDLIKKEIDKCILLCANCHRKVHNKIIIL